MKEEETSLQKFFMWLLVLKLVVFAWFLTRSNEEDEEFWR